MKTTIPSEYSNKEVIIYSNYLPMNIYRIIICILCTRHVENVLSHCYGEIDFLKENKDDNRYILSHYLTLSK